MLASFVVAIMTTDDVDKSKRKILYKAVVF
jgi:hypothetical protein